MFTKLLQRFTVFARGAKRGAGGGSVPPAGGDGTRWDFSNAENSGHLLTAGG